jgi:SAM-dependent methyltransferase
MGPVDFGKTAGDYARHRAGFPEAFFERLSRLGVGRPGQRVLDLGSGTGTVARGLAKRGCRVTGLDRSALLIEQARILDSQAAVSIDYVVASAEETGLGAASFDVVTAGQCWHWFDRARAIREARRVLVGGGHLVIAHFDWVSLPGNVARRTEELIRSHNPDWNLGSAPADGTGVYPQWLVDMAVGGFADIETFSFDVDVPYSHEDWRGRIRASAGVGASLPAHAIERFAAELERMLGETFAEPLRIPHRVWAALARAPATQ